MKCRNQNRPSLFPGRTSLEATKPGFNFLCLFCVVVRQIKSEMVLIVVCVSLGQGSSLLWTHTLRPFYSRPIPLTKEGRSLVNDVCECVRDCKVRRGE